MNIIFIFLRKIHYDFIRMIKSTTNIQVLYRTITAVFREGE